MFFVQTIRQFAKFERW